MSTATHTNFEAQRAASDSSKDTALIASSSRLSDQVTDLQMSSNATLRIFAAPTDTSGSGKVQNYLPNLTIVFSQIDSDSSKPGSNRVADGGTAVTVGVSNRRETVTDMDTGKPITDEKSTKTSGSVTVGEATVRLESVEGVNKDFETRRIKTSGEINAEVTVRSTGSDGSVVTTTAGGNEGDSANKTTAPATAVKAAGQDHGGLAPEGS